MRVLPVLVGLMLPGVFALNLEASNVIMVNNGSFENLPTSGLNNPNAAGPYSVGTIPGWTGSGSGSEGQWQPTSAAFSSIPNGSTIGYTNGGTLTQAVATVSQGYTYTMTVDIGTRADAPDLSTATAAIIVNGIAYEAIGTQATKGNWSVFTATYTALPSDAGASIYIQLAYNGDYQGDFDNVQMFDAVPEPASAALLVIGLGYCLIRRRSDTEPAAN